MERDKKLFIWCSLISVFSLFVIFALYLLTDTDCNLVQAIICVFSGIFGSSFVLAFNKLLDYDQSKRDKLKEIYLIFYSYYRAAQYLKPVFVNESFGRDISFYTDGYVNFDVQYYRDALNFSLKNIDFGIIKKEKSLNDLIQKMSKFLDNEITIINLCKLNCLNEDNESVIRHQIEQYNHYLFERVDLGKFIIIYSRMGKDFLNCLNRLYSYAYSGDCKEHKLFFVSKMDKEHYGPKIPSFDSFDPMCDNAKNQTKGLKNMFEYSEIMKSIGDSNGSKEN